MQSRHLSFRLTLLLALSSQLRLAVAQLPIVDVGYTLYQASTFSPWSQTYTFSNLRYAAPPLGPLRFSAPAPPATDRNLQPIDTSAPQCAQAPPLWVLNPSPSPPQGNEDCLFLDVVTPSVSASLPVLVWIHGGGFVMGSKAGGTPLEGLVKAAGGQLVAVRLNYRLGSFGFLSGSALREAGGVSNAGLLDQRFALEWVKENISKFGGDPSQVTIIGESAGGGSVLSQITAYGAGSLPSAPFKRAILQSPSLRPAIAADATENLYNNFLSLAGCSDLACLRGLATGDLMAANQKTTAPSQFGTYGWAPAMDGPFMPDFPPRLLAQINAPEFSVMVGHNTNEKMSYANASVTDFPAFVDQYFPFAPAPVRDTIKNEIYPESEYASTFDRLSAMLIDSRISCTSSWAAHAFAATGAWTYQFAVPPATHGLDVGYTFFNGTDEQLGGKNKTVVAHLQGYVANFATKGDPNGDGLVNFPKHGTPEEKHMIRLNITDVNEIPDPTENSRCVWLQQGLWVPAPA